MKTKQRKILSLFLVVLMMVSVIPMGTISAFALTSGDYSYEIISESAKTCRITKYNGTGTDITVPKRISGYLVTEIADQAFYDCKSLKSVVIPGTVMSIGTSDDYSGSGAFQYCALLESVTIESGVKAIQERAFENCTSLKSIVIPDTVTKIGWSAFEDCTRLESAVIPGSVKEIQKDTFYNCTSLTTVTIGNGVTEIADQAFYNCKSLKSVVIPGTVMSIGTSDDYSGSGAFQYCALLESVTIESGVKAIQERAFENCTSLKSIVIPDTVTKIGEDAFYKCPNAAIFGYRDSYAQTYAKENDIPFIALNGITQILIQSKPSKTDYFVNDKFNTDGLSVRVNMYDGTSEIITGGFNISSPDMSTAGTKTVKVTLEGEEASFKINVTALFTPSLNKISNTAKGVTVSWSKVGIAKSYNVYRKAGNATSWTRIASVTGTAYTDSKVSSGTKYTYTVRAVNGSDMSGYNTKGISILRLAQPTFKVDNQNGYVRVAWNKVAGATGYYVYRKAPNSKSWTRIATVTGTAYNDKNVKSGTNYTYTVKAYNGSTYSSYHSGVAIKYLARPTFKVANQNGYVRVAWNKVAGATGYYVYRKAPNANSWTRIATVSGTAYNDKNVKSGSNYVYTVRAFNGKFTSTFHSGLAIKYLARPTFKVANKSNNVTVAWSKVAGAKGYYVYRKAGNATSWTRVATVTGTAYADKNVKKNVKYTYTVKAYNGKYTSTYHSGAGVKH